MYLPAWRLDRATIAEAHGAPAGAGRRAVAAFDEDSTSMGVEACRLALRTAVEAPCELWFATTSPAYADKTNATAIHAALRLPPEAAAYDVVGSLRSGLGALRAASERLRPGDRPWRCCPTYVPDCPAPVTSAVAVTRPPRSSSTRVRRRWSSSWPGPR